MLSSVLNHKKAVMCLMEKIWMLDKLPSGLIYSSVGYEFNISESTIQYALSNLFLNSNTHKTRLCVGWSTKM